MNAKGLISIARRAEDGLSYAEQVELADHILSIVRQDDDEPVTRERMEADGAVRHQRSTQGRFYVYQGMYVVEQDDGTWQLHETSTTLRSMGHLRRLVAALGE